MSDTHEESRTDLSRRGLLRATAAAGLLGLPAAGLLDACGEGIAHRSWSSGCSESPNRCWMPPCRSLSMFVMPLPE